MRLRRVGSRGRGFTLVELLAAVGIFLVLVTLLLGGGQMVRETSERAKCSSHLRALGGAIHAYAAENQGNLPPGSRGNIGKFNNLLSEYLTPMKSPTFSPDVFYCPTNVRLGSPPAGGYSSGGKPYKGWSGYFFNYTLNASIFPITNSDPASTGYVADELGIVRLLNVRFPSRTVALLDMQTRAPGASGPPTSGMSKASYFDPKNKNYLMGPVHRGQGNVLFVDGHVETFPGNAALPVMSLPSQEQPWWP